MIFSETTLAGAYTVDIDRREDNRGRFARVFCQQEFSARGLKSMVAQASLSFNTKRGTLRGLHFQYPPAVETKYVRCTKGAISDVIVDLRPGGSLPSRITCGFLICFHAGATDLTSVKWTGPTKCKLDHSNVSFDEFVGAQQEPLNVEP